MNKEYLLEQYRCWKELATADEDIIYVSDGETNGDGSQSSPFNSISDAVNLYNSSVNSNRPFWNSTFVP